MLKALIILLLSLNTIFIEGVFAGSLAFPYKEGDCHLKRTKSCHVKAGMELDLRTRYPVEKWVAYCACPPELERQKALSSKLAAKGSDLKARVVAELSPSARNVHCLEISCEKQDQALRKFLPLQAQFEMTLYKTELAKGKAPDMVPSLPDLDRKLNLMPTFSLDYDSKSFRTFLNENKLRKKEHESDLDFAWRAYCRLLEKFRYHWDQTLDRRISITCLRDSSDCAGLSYLFCGILRASGIPARALIGRMAYSSPLPEDYSDTFACHVKSEFFVRNIGWIPVDISDALRNPKTNKIRFFGQDRGDFIVMHINPDLLLSCFPEGQKKVRSMPDFRYWSFGGAKERPKRRIIWKVERQN